jgi:hypothetical protein
VQVGVVGAAGSRNVDAKLGDDPCRRRRQRDHAIGEQERLDRVGRREDDRLAGRGPDGEELFVKRRPRPRVERREGLVEQQDRRIGGEGAGERHAMLLARRELRGRRVLDPVQRHEIERAARDRGALEGGEPTVAQRELHVAARRSTETNRRR